MFVSWRGVTWLMSPLIRLMSFTNFCRIYLMHWSCQIFLLKCVVLCLQVLLLKVMCCGVPEQNLFKYASLKLIR